MTAPALHNQHRTNIGIYWERTAQVLTLTPTVDDSTNYAGTIRVRSPGGVLLATTAFDFDSDVDATVEEIVTGILADLTGGDVDDYLTLTGTATAILTADNVGYTIEFKSTGAGTIGASYSGKAANPGAVPANAAAWATSGWRIKTEEADHGFILGAAAVPNADMQPRVHAVDKPHKGLPTADGGTIRSRLWSTGGTYSAGDQVPPTGLGMLLEHALGGSSRGNDTDVATVNSQVSFDLTSVAHMAVGQILAFEDADDPGRLWPAQITGISGSTVTVDRQQPWAVAASDKVHGAECAYPDQAALTNPQDAGYSTVSLLYQKGPHVWVAGGAHLGLDSLAVERGQQPKLSWTVNAARGYTPGAGAPTEPTWTDTIQGALDTLAIGRDTKCFLGTYGATTSSLVSLFSASIQIGVPVLPQDGVTEIDDGMPGRVGYRTEPAETIVELVVALDETQQTRWTAGTYLTVTYFQVAARGYAWCVHVAKGFMAGPPTPTHDGTNRWTIRLQATDNDAAWATTELAKAKILLARY